jgi:hypothetical protein
MANWGRVSVSGLMILMLGSGAVGCRFFKSKATVSEAPTAENRFSTLGIEGDVFWKDVKDLTSAAAPTPWSDTYWPLFQKGLSNRWMAKNYGAVSPKPDPITLWDQVTNLITVLDSKDPVKIALLSPAEKYDLIVSKGARPAESVKASLKAISDEFKADKEVQDLLAQLKPAAQALRKAEKDLMALQTECDQILKRMGALYDGGADENNPELKTLRARLEPLQEKLQLILTEYQAQQANTQMISATMQKAGRTYIERMAAQISALGKTWPMLADGWSQWSEYAGVFEGEWTWMGHCHGWATASLMEASPKHGVVVKTNGQEIFFSEGDIRGLLTKIWADNGSESLFTGKRCNSATYDTDRRGRIVDGTICYDAKGNTCSIAESGKIIYMRNEYNGAYGFTESIYAKKSKIAVVDRQLSQDNIRVRVYESKADAQSGSRNFKSAVMHLTLGCRDTNPATFHAALTKLIAGKKTGFVVDVTRSDQVWNQPAYAYDLSYLPITKKNGKTSEGAEPVSVKEIADPFMAYRAPGTQYLVQVRATLKYGLEAGPLLSYRPEDNASGDATFVYTLELDKDQRLIGGEWGPVPVPGKENALSEVVNQFRNGESVDFLWRYKEGSKPREGALSYELIKKIHNCSLSDVGLKARKIGNIPEVQVTECVL